MALKITLKPSERMIIGGAVVTNGNSRSSQLIVENDIPILREKDILSENDVDSPTKRIYFTIQLMYIDEGNLSTHTESYWKLVRELLEAAPSLTGVIDQINEEIVNGRYYQALKFAGQLIAYEQEVISRVQ
jgi:flagellar protein FlbT